MTGQEWKKFGRGMLLIVILFTVCGIAVGTCRGVSTVTQRLIERLP